MLISCFYCPKTFFYFDTFSDADMTTEICTKIATWVGAFPSCARHKFPFNVRSYIINSYIYIVCICIFLYDSVQKADALLLSAYRINS